MADSMPTARETAAMEPARPAPDAPLQEWTAYILALQAPACRILGSELYAQLLEAAATDVRSGGPAWAVLEPHATRDSGAALGLRFMAAVHRVVLERRAPELALYFSSVGGTAGPDGAWPVLRRVLVEQHHRLQELAARPCQTNEVGRCAALIGGFLLAARESGLPLRLLEIGASAGLNLRWDRYRYADVDGEAAWGDPDSPVQLTGHWEVPDDLTRQEVFVAGRAGCDPRPIDARTDEGRMGLTASVWGDQPQRFARLAGALEVAADLPVDVAEEPAVTWLPAQLATPAPGTATVVYHSVVMQYMNPKERERVVALLHDTGATATAGAPLYWLRMEPERPLRAMSVRLTAWPGGDDRLIATAGAHGNPLRWRL
jgi:hypothetical protein